MKTLICLVLVCSGAGAACLIWYQLHLRVDIIPLAICFIMGWLAGWGGRWLWVDIERRERPKEGRRESA